MSSTSSNPRKSIPPIRSSTDFARYVGLARTTVSRVLNGQPGLKQKTIDKVKRAIEETGFVPNAYALHLKGKRTSTIGVCMENLLTPPVVQKLAVLQQLLREQNFTSLIEVFEPSNGAQVIRHFLSMRVDGIVFIGHFDEEQLTRHISELNARAMPHVIIDHFGIKGANTVTLDRARGMSELMEHLMSQGHRSFALLGFSGVARSTRDRLRGIRTAIEERGLSFAASTHSMDHLALRGNDFEYGRLVANGFAEHGNVPTAFIALNDQIAIGAMHGLQEKGLKVPGDVSVAGFNNQDICLMPTPSLTSIDQRVPETINAAVEVLLPQIGDTSRAKSVVRMIDPLLVIRESTGAART